MIVGYAISGNASNDVRFLDGTEPAGTWCPNCGTCLDLEYAPNHLPISKSKRYDISFTHDLRTLFSERMTSFLREHLDCGEDFKPITTPWETLYYTVPKRSVPFDVVTRKTQFISPCTSCGGFRDVIGAHPAYLQTSLPLGNGLYRSDISFSSFKSKQFLLFVGRDWMEQIKTQNFRGISFKEVHSIAAT